jgi:hypothetical protein
MYTGGLAGLGCLLAGGHPLSILTAIAVAPFKPFRLSIPTGAFSALVEARLRKPAYEDFLKLRDDAQSLKGWYRNRVTRVVLTFMLTNIGSMLGLWLTTFKVWWQASQPATESVAPEPMPSTDGRAASRKRGGRPTTTGLPTPQHVGAHYSRAAPGSTSPARARGGSAASRHCAGHRAPHRSSAGTAG